MGNFTATTIVHSIIVHKAGKKYAKKVWCVRAELLVMNAAAFTVHF